VLGPVRPWSGQGYLPVRRRATANWTSSMLMGVDRGQLLQLQAIPDDDVPH
jgi:hypothetical protein